MLAQVNAAALYGISGTPIKVEVDVTHGLPQFNLVGLPDTAVRKHGNSQAAANSGFSFHCQRITVNQPGGLFKRASFISSGYRYFGDQAAPLSSGLGPCSRRAFMDGSLRPIQYFARSHALPRGFGRFLYTDNAAKPVGYRSRLRSGHLVKWRKYCGIREAIPVPEKILRLTPS